MASPTIDRPIHQRRRARGNDQVEAQPQVDWVDTVAADQDHRLTQAAACLEQALDGDVAPACTAAVGGSGGHALDVCTGAVLGRSDHDNQDDVGMAAQSSATDSALAERAAGLRS
jgi:hypothetical protein